MIDRKNWIYPDEERLTSIVNTEEVKSYLIRCGNCKTMVEFFEEVSKCTNCGEIIKL